LRVIQRSIKRWLKWLTVRKAIRARFERENPPAIVITRMVRVWLFRKNISVKVRELAARARIEAELKPKEEDKGTDWSK
jgi:hypothetical protein